MAAQQASVHMMRKARLHTLRRARDVQKDKSLTCFTKDVRIALLRSTASCNSAFQKFDVRNEQAAALFGRALTSSLLMSCFNKGEERCILDFQSIDSTAPIPRIYAESMRLGEVRGYIHGDQVTSRENLDGFEGLLGLPPSNPKSHNLNEAARGRLNVHRVLYSQAKPATSAVVCPTGDITQDVNWFLEQSDQTPGHMHIETQWGPGETPARGGADPPPTDAAQAAFVGGVFVQLLAEGDESVLERVVDALRSGKVSLWQLQQAGKPLPEVAASLLPELGLVTDDEGKHFFQNAGAVHPQRTPPASAPLAAAVLAAQADIAAEGGSSALGPNGAAPVQQVPVDFFCRCSKYGFLQQLRRLPQADLQGMRDETPAPVLTCQFCNTGYTLEASDMDSIFPAAAQAADPIASEASTSELR